MAFRKLYEVHQGKIGLKLFRSMETKELFLAVDKIVAGKTLRGPFLSEADVRFLVKLLARHKETRPHERTDGPLHPKELAVEEVKAAAPEGAPIQLDIHEALVKAHNQTSKEWTITAVSPMLHYAYVYTCNLCGTDFTSRVVIDSGATLKLCPACEHMHSMAI